MKIESQAFEHEGEIPEKYTCDGEDISAPLTISEIPSETKTLAIIVDDPDAPGTIFDHWIIWNIKPNQKTIPEAIPQNKKINSDSLGTPTQGTNDFDETGYRGPCPPPGPDHGYRFKVYALNKKIDLSPEAKKEDLEREMKDNIIDQDQITGKYNR